MSIGFVGAGAMAGAIVRGAVTSGRVAGPDLVVTSRTPASREALAAEVGARAVASPAEVVGGCDLVVLAVKPHQLGEVLASVADVVAHRRPVLVSVAAGVRLAELGRLLGRPGVPLVRVMPNVNVAVGAGISGMCAGPGVTDDHRRAVTELFGAVGEVVELEERLFPAFTAVAGSGPAFTATYVEALARAGLRHGLPKALALRLATTMVAGTVRLLTEQELTPPQLVDRVSSPGGTTVAGLCALDEAGFPAAVVRAVSAAVARDAELGT